MTNSSHRNDDRRLIIENIDALAAMAASRIEAGWHGTLLTVVFERMRGGPATVIGQMGDAVERLYSTLVTNVVRRPTADAAIGRLPILIAAPDLPVPKRSRPTGSPILLNNGGMHMHGALFVRPRSRLRMPVEEHLRLNDRLYLRAPVAMLDARPITQTPERALAYLLKSIQRGRFSYDNILILPRSLSEMRA